MPYISGKELMQHALKENYAIGGFSAHNAETIQAILRAAQKKQAPVILMIGQKVIENMGLEQMKAMVDCFMADIDVPVCVHLDHSRKFEQTAKAIQLGFNSVMFDGSGFSFEENTATTKKLADFAHVFGIGVEGEIGKIGGTEDDITVSEEDAMLTTPEEALEFVKQTGVDYLAVSIGTAHGVYKKEPKLAFDRLKAIREKVDKPIVLHGGSGVPDEQVRKAISLGVCKVNVDTELRQAFTQGIVEVLKENEKEYQLGVSLGTGIRKMQEKVEEKIELFGSQGKAKFFK